MNFFAEAFAWLFSPERLEGDNAIPILIQEHLLFTFVSVGIAAAIAIPVGFFVGHTGKGRELAVIVSGSARALPSLGLILLLVLIVGVRGRPLAVGIALVLLAIPPILAGAYSGIESVNRRTVDAARAVGMTEWQILWKVEVPLGLSLLVGGIRSAALQVVATATLAAYVGVGGLGYFLIRGLALRRYEEVLASAILVVVLALLVDAAFALAQQGLVPRGVTAGRTKDFRTAPVRRRAVVGTPIEEGKG